MKEKVKLSVYGTEFFINRKKNRVRCKIQFDFKGPVNLICALRHFMMLTNDPIEFDLIAEANLDPQDTFDINKGMSVARAKAESMAYNRAWGLIDRFTRFMDDNIDLNQEFVEKARGVIEHNNKYLSTF